MGAPKIEVLSRDEMELVHSESLDLLENMGILVENNTCLEILEEHGCSIDWKSKVAKIPRSLVGECLKKAIREFELHGTRKSLPPLPIGGSNTFFNPGSAALYLYDPNAGVRREPRTEDLARFCALVELLDSIHMQSTALVARDVPEPLYDRWRLLAVVLNSSKPVVTGAFTVEGLLDMVKMLEIVRGGREELLKRPCAIFDVCPSPPLRWSYLTSQNLVDCARLRIPAEIIPMPAPGATSPATLHAALIQHHAEFLSGLVIAHCAGERVPVVYGGSPGTFDMRYGLMAIAGIEALLLDCAYAEMGKYLGLPTHAYMAISDSKEVDYQAGLEVGMGALLAVLAEINVVSGPGMMEEESVQCLEKLVADAEACALALRFKKGISVEPETSALQVFYRVGHRARFLWERHTIEWYRREFYVPSKVLDRMPRSKWERGGKPSLPTRASERVEELLGEFEPPPLEEELERELIEYATSLLASHGVGKNEALRLIEKARYRRGPRAP